MPVYFVLHFVPGIRLRQVVSVLAIHTYRRIYIHTYTCISLQYDQLRAARKRLAPKEVEQTEEPTTYLGPLCESAKQQYELHIQSGRLNGTQMCVCIDVCMCMRMYVYMYFIKCDRGVRCTCSQGDSIVQSAQCMGPFMYVWTLNSTICKIYGAIYVCMYVCMCIR